MGDIFQILIIVGIIVVALVKQLGKATKEAEEEKRRRIRLPEVTETEEPSLRPFLSYDREPTASPPISPSRKEMSAAPAHKNSKTEYRNEQPQLPPLPATAGEPEFDIHSIEEVRRGILWSEILNRKY